MKLCAWNGDSAKEVQYVEDTFSAFGTDFCNIRLC